MGEDTGGGTDLGQSDNEKESKGEKEVEGVRGTVVSSRWGWAEQGHIQ